MSKYLERINEVIQVEATTSSVGDFLVTHKPFKNLYNFAINPGLSSNAIDEEMLYDDIFHKNINNHQFVVIQGTQGCGKSHLIRWMKVRLEEEIDKNNEAVMFISRNHNTLQDAIKQILESDIFPDEIKNNQIKKLKENSSTGLTGDELKKQIIFNFKLAMDADENTDILDKLMKDMLKTFIQDEYIQNKFLLQAQSPIERIRQKMESSSDLVNFDESPIFNSNDFIMSTQELISDDFKDVHRHTRRMAEKLNSNYDAQKNRELVARYLNSKVSEVIERSEKFRATDLKELFNALRVELKKEGKNLVLFIEDLTAFTGLDKAIVEVLVTNHQAEGNEEYCRLVSVVGLTRAFYDDNIPDNLRDRITTNVLINTSNTNDNKETFFKDKNEIARFAGRYINAINLNKQTIDEWVKNGADYSRLPIFDGNNKHNWANIDDEDKIFSIYPFNKNALWNLYFSIPETKRTPRAFLKDILKYLLSIYAEKGIDFIRYENYFNNGIIKVPNWSNEKAYEQDNESYFSDDIIPRKILLCVWGNQTTEKYDSKVGDVEEEVFKEFNISTDIFDKSNSENPIIKKDPLVAPKQKEPIKVVPLTNENYEKLYQEINDWASKDKAALPSHIELRELFIKTVVNTIDWFKYDIPRQLIENFTAKNIKIEGQTLDSGSKYLVNLYKNQETKYLLVSLIGFKYKGKNSWSYDNSCDDYVNYITWIKNNEKDIVNFVRAQKGTYFDIPLYNVACEYYLKAFLGMVNNKESDLDIVKSLLLNPQDKTIVFNNASDYWKETYNYIKKNFNPEQLHRNSMHYFMKLFGDESTDTVKYKLFDVSLILDKLEQLKAINFNINNLELDNISDEGTSLSYLQPVSFLKFISQKVNKLVEDGKKDIKNNSVAILSALGENLSEKDIHTVLEKMDLFLRYLQNELNIPFPMDKFRDLLNGNIKSSYIYKILMKINEIENEKFLLNNIELIADFEFELLIKINMLFLNYANFLVEEKKNYSGTTENSDAQQLSKYKEETRKSIKEMLKSIEEES